LGEAVYNAFEARLLFRERAFRPHCFETGTPTVLVDVLTERGLSMPRLAYRRADESLLSAFDVEHLELEALLRQTRGSDLQGVASDGRALGIQAG
jgi:hypothetical protein